jgi:hypothetical protein
MDINNTNANDNITQNEEEEDKLPDYEDDEEFTRQMNEAIMRNIQKLEADSLDKSPKKTKINHQIQNIKQVKIKDKKVNNISLGNFMKDVDDKKPTLFVSKRKQDKIGQQYKRVFNPRLPPYLLVKVAKKESVLNENDFPSL